MVTSLEFAQCPKMVCDFFERGVATNSMWGSRGPGCCLAALSTECSLWRVRDLIYGTRTIGRLFLLHLLQSKVSETLLILLDILESENFVRKTILLVRN